MTLDLLPAHVIGRVLDRTEALTVVTDHDEEVRVRWRGKRSRNGARGYLCDRCGITAGRSPCPHARAAHQAITDQREAERRARANREEAPDEDG